MVCSPLSLDIVLGMLTVGADGNTLKQLLGFLRYGNIDQFLYQSPSAKLLAQSLSNQKRDGLEFILANGVWVDKYVKLESRYERILEDFYKTQAKHVDFKDKVNFYQVFSFLSLKSIELKNLFLINQYGFLGEA